MMIFPVWIMRYTRKEQSCQSESAFAVVSTGVVTHIYESSGLTRGGGQTSQWQAAGEEEVLLHWMTLDLRFVFFSRHWG